MEENLRDMPRLETDRLTLRPFCLYDAKPYFIMASRNEILEFTDMPHPIDLDMIRDWIMNHGKSWKAFRDLYLLITLQETRQIVGSISLFIYQNHRKADIGYAIHPDFWGQGIATEAASLLVRYAFEELNLSKLEANHLDRNATSARVLSKLGFTPEGLLRKSFVKNDITEDLRVYGLLKDEYKK